MPPKKKRARQGTSTPPSSSSSPSKPSTKKPVKPKAVQSKKVTPVVSGNKKGKQKSNSDDKKQVKAKIEPIQPKRKQDSDDDTDDSEIEEGEVILVGDNRKKMATTSSTSSTAAKLAAPPTSAFAPQATIRARSPLFQVQFTSSPTPPMRITAEKMTSTPSTSRIAGLPAAPPTSVFPPQAPIRASSPSFQMQLNLPTPPMQTTAALPPPPAWNNDEKKEAMRLIKDITSLGLKPMQLVEAGIRQDIVIACCRELNIAMNGSKVQPDPRSSLRLEEHPLMTSRIAKSPSPPFSPSIKIQSSPVPALSSSSSSSLPPKPNWTNPSAISIDHSQVNPRLLSKKAMKAIQKKAEEEGQGVIQEGASVVSLSSSQDQKPAKKEIRSTMKVQLNISQPKEDPKVEMTETPSAMEAMRLAALASMKRKKSASTIVSTNGSTSAAPLEEMDADNSTHSGSQTYSPAIESPRGQLIGLPIDVPRGPKSSKPIYHDIDAPTDQVIDLIEDEDEMQQMPSSSRASDADPRQSKRSNLSYADDYSWEADAPSGDVDLEAPLPSLQLQSKTIIGGAPSRRRPLAADLMDMSGTSTPDYYYRPRPFLADTSQTQRLILEYSDDEDEDSNDDMQGKVRQASTTFISQLYKQMNGSEDDFGTSSRNGQALTVPTPPNGIVRRSSPLPSNHVDTLSRKEQEIKEMMAKIAELERKKGQAPSDPQVLVQVAKATLEDVKDQEMVIDKTTANPIPHSREQRQESSMPAYESPFARYPSLRSVLHRDG